MDRGLYRVLEAISRDRGVVLFYTVLDSPNREFKVLRSSDGMSFERVSGGMKVKTPIGALENLTAVRDAAIAALPHGGTFLTYVRKTEKGMRLYGALSRTGATYHKVGLLGGIRTFGALVADYQYQGKYALYYGNRSLRVALSEDLRSWQTFEAPVLEPRPKMFDSTSLKMGRALLTNEGIAVFYLAKNDHKRLCLGAALFDKKSPSRLLWRTAYPIWEQPDDWKADKIRLVGLIAHRDRFLAYFEPEDGRIFAEALTYTAPATPKFLKTKPRRERRTLEPKILLTRHEDNPIISPRAENEWEALATFNPAAIELEGKIHLLYRAQGYDGLSVLGYAASSDGIHIDERAHAPAFIPTQSFDKRRRTAKRAPFPYVSGGGWGGCEDPRLTLIDDRIYMTYVAFNGAAPPGVALTSIDTDNFIKRRWEWDVPKLISRPGQIHKNWVVFPEKIGGKFAILHSLSPQVLIDYRDTLDDDITIDSYHNSYSPGDRWDNIVRGVGAPPLWTAFGWLVLYHAMDRRDPHKYKVGAMLLDLERPERILHRCAQPVLEPQTSYENNGLKSGVVYVCGAVIKGDRLFVYYGGSDMCVAVASASLHEFIGALRNAEAATLTPVTILKKAKS